MEYLRWLMVAGACLVVVGFVGLAFHRNRETKASNARQGPEIVEGEEITATAK